MPPNPKATPEMFPVRAVGLEKTATTSQTPEEYCTAVPFYMMQLHEKQAWLNHGQTLIQLAEHGLTPHQVLAILQDCRWPVLEDAEAEARLDRMVTEWES